MFNYLPEFTDIHGAIHSLIGTNRKLVREGNIIKLYKRYEGAVYSDQAAQDRADKAPDHEDGPEFEGYNERAGNKAE